jgi:hypothetical protein
MVTPGTVLVCRNVGATCWLTADRTNASFIDLEDVFLVLGTSVGLSKYDSMSYNYIACLWRGRVCFINFVWLDSDFYLERVTL